MDRDGLSLNVAVGLVVGVRVRVSVRVRVEVGMVDAGTIEVGWEMDKGGLVTTIGASVGIMDKGGLTTAATGVSVGVMDKDGLPSRVGAPP